MENTSGLTTVKNDSKKENNDDQIHYRPFKFTYSPPYRGVVNMNLTNGSSLVKFTK